jgi:CrcB protein
MTEASVWAAVAGGGAIGALLRGALFRWLARLARPSTTAASGLFGIGRGTLVVNVLGSFLLGALFTLYAESPATHPLRIFWLTGFCGALTTFSTFCADVVLIHATVGRAQVVTYVVAQSALCVAALSIGRALAS